MSISLPVEAEQAVAEINGARDRRRAVGIGTV